ncbi:MAG: TetR/AcrR family transcriptional regulator [Acidimicrobiia bacterium]
MVMEPLTESQTDPQVALDSRIAGAALRLVARYGLAKLTLDDVAREAGCSRATLYRYYPGKQALLAAVVAAEEVRLQAGLDEALADVSTLDEALSAAAGLGAREFAGHAALQFLLAHEPGAVLPHLCFAGADRLLATVSDAAAPHLGRFLPTLQARRVAEWLARIVLSYGCTPPDPGASADAAVFGVVKDFVTPAVTGGKEATRA